MMTSETWPAVIPMPAYEDVERATIWLCEAFGFRELQRYEDDTGRVTTSILEVPAGGVIMPGWVGPDYQGPQRHAETCDVARRWREVPYIIDGILVTVDNVDGHHARAVKTGATILSEPEDTPVGRHYRAEDLEGHRWMFTEATR